MTLGLVARTEGQPHEPGPDSGEPCPNVRKCSLRRCAKFRTSRAS